MGNSTSAPTVEKSKVLSNELPAFRKLYSGKTLDTKEEVSIFCYNGESFNTLAVQEVIHHVMSVRSVLLNICPRLNLN